MIKIIHRGWIRNYPENSILALKDALDKNFDGIETDLRLTMDNKWVLHHDITLERMCLIEKNLSDVEYKNIPNLYWKDKETNIKLATLIQLLKLNINYNKILNLEIKEKYNCTTKENMDNLLNMCQTQKNNIIFSSFDWDWYDIIKKNGYKFAHLIEHKNRLPKNGDIYFFSKKLKIPKIINVELGIFTLNLQETCDYKYNIIDSSY